MLKIKAYDLYAREYDRWYDDNKSVYASELHAVKSLIPQRGLGVDIGTGTGRFACPFHINIGVEPSPAMRKIARERGIKVVDAVAEKLPFENNSFDYALMITVTCFLDDVNKSFKEACRILKPNGSLIVAHIEKNSYLGKIYSSNKNADPFLKDATLYKTEEILDFLKIAGFKDFNIKQTLFEEYQGKNMVQPVKKGSDQGAFVVIRGVKK